MLLFETQLLKKVIYLFLYINTNKSSKNELVLVLLMLISYDGLVKTECVVHFDASHSLKNTNVLFRKGDSHIEMDTYILQCVASDCRNKV